MTVKTIMHSKINGQLEAGKYWDHMDIFTNLTSPKHCESSPMADTQKRKVDDTYNDQLSRKKRKQKYKGMNKNRGPTFKVHRENQLCPYLIDRRTDNDPGCSINSCQFIHDLETFLKLKLPSLGEECYVFNVRGHCPRGLTCRFGSKHVSENGLNIVNKEKLEEWNSNSNLITVNSIKNDVQVQLRKRTYDFTRANSVLDQWNKEYTKSKESTDNNCTDKTENKSSKCDGEEISVVNEDCCSELDNGSLDNNDDAKVVAEAEGSILPETKLGPVLDNDLIKFRSSEKKKIDWRNKLLLSPLTTVGNLPFRRVCKEWGADVTCGEMAMAVNLLQGKQQEWALTKRHGSEDLFGVQICGGNVTIMTKCAQLIQDQAHVDFIDINVGCPIDLVYQQGAGSGLLNKKKVLFSIVKCMKSVLDIPLTVKTRTGVYSGKNVAHLYMADLAKAGADLVTVHGRTKEQRYTKLADWEYIEKCAKLASPIPLIGNGDILSFLDYDLAKERSQSAAGVMIGRGALIKPWLFTEIKEHRHWDISSHERYDMLKRYVNYGLEHWGSDTKGVESTRRFLLEWLSFLYRYVPVGLMETPPQKMNERPPKFEGRNDLEVLMASPNCADWIKLSEMLLGPVPDGFNFIPKHKANSWT